MDRAVPPLPRPSPESEPFWSALREGRFQLQRCGSCGHFRFPPAVHCPHCWGADASWETLSGRGRVFSHVTFRRGYHPAFPPPYVVAVIELQEGPRLASRLVGVEPERVDIGMPVRVELTAVAESVVLPLFRPESEEDER